MYKDANFFRVETTLARPKGERALAIIYGYRGASKLYDIVVPVDGGEPMFRVNSKRKLPNTVHREIDKHFNLMLRSTLWTA